MLGRQRGKRTLRTKRALRAAIESLEPLECRRLLAGVVINEFLAQNSAGIVDQDNDHSDWIEIRNTDTTSVNLTGWSLTDDAGNLTKWQFPSTTVPAGGYLVVYASGKNRAVSGQQLHTSFSLDEDGEYLALVKPGGTIIADSFAPFPEQLADVSYGHGSTSSVVDTLIGEDASAKAKVPTAASGIDATWRQTSFVPDGTWLSGATGVGYDTSTSGTDFNPYIGLSVSSAMSSGVRTTAYIRIEFTVADPSAFTALQLSMMYDDGFIAYVNGTEIGTGGNQRRMFSTGGTPAWNSVATGTRNDDQCVIPEIIDISGNLNLLNSGTNVLAIHALNVSNSSDLLINPVLTADRGVSTSAVFMAAPTPGATNSSGTLGFVGDTNFSVDRGFYTSAQSVAITTSTPGATIRYTLDGSVPTATTGTIYSGPVTIEPPVTTGARGVVTLRAAAFKTGWTPTDVDTQSYIFLSKVIQQSGAGLPSSASWGHAGADWAMDPDVVNNPTYSGTIINDLKSVPTMSLVMPWADWFGSGGAGIYPSGSGVEKATSVEMISDSSPSDEFQLDAAVEIQGASSTQRWNEDKLSMRLTFKPPYGPTKLEHNLFKHPTLDKNAATKFDRLILDAMYDDSWMDPSSTNRANAKMIQDQYAADLQNLAGGNAPHARFVHLYLNGVYWGMYYLHEEPDDGWAEEYFDGDKADYNIIKHNGTTVVSGDNTGANSYSSLMSAVRQSMTSSSNYAAVVAKLDIDAFIDYMLVNHYIGNTDWASHNWYASYDRVNDKKWRFHSWDAELSLRSVTTDNTTKNDSGAPTEILQRLMVNPEFKVRFNDRVQKHMQNGGVLSPTGAAAIYQMRVDEIDRAIVGESARWGDNKDSSPRLRSGWRATQDALQVNYFPQRTQNVLNQYANTSNHPGSWLLSLGAPTYSQFGGMVNPGYQLTISKPAGSPGGAVIYYTLDGSDPRVYDPATGNVSISPTATLYSGPVTLNVAKRVKARVFNSGSWSAVVDATFLTPNLFPVRISELHYHPDNHAGVVDPEDMEFIELVNTGTSTVNLAGVQINGAIDPYTFSSVNLAAGQRIVVARTPSIFDQVYGTGINRATMGYTGKLDNAGEAITLLGPLGETLQTFTYDDNSPWVTTPDGDGPSLEIIDPLGDPGAASNWSASVVNGGTPGTTGSAPTVVTSTFQYETGHSIRVEFDHDMNPATFAGTDLAVQLQPGGAIVNPTSVSFLDAKTAIFTFATPLADGNYHATLATGSVNDTGGLATSNSAELDFFVLRGDANRDRHVDAADQAIVTAHLNQSGTFSLGDFDYSGAVNTADQTILNQQLKLWLPTVGPVNLPVTGNDDAYRVRRESASVMEIYAGADVTPTYRLILDGVASLAFAGGIGNDTLVLDASNGSPIGVVPLNFDGGNAGSDVLKLIGTANPDTATWNTSSVTLGATATYASVETRVFDGGGGFENLTIDGVRVTFTSSQRFDNLHLTDGARADLQAGGDKSLGLRGLQLDGSAQLDLADNDLLLDYTGVSPIGSWDGSAYTDVTGMLASGRNAGAWNGAGIISSAADPGGFTTLGIGEASRVLGLSGAATALWNGQTADATSILLKFTYGGDANLDGHLDVDDYGQIDFNAATGGQLIDWLDGDFNLDGIQDVDDYGIIDFVLSIQGPAL